MPEEIKDKDIKVGEKTIGFSSIVKLNVKTLLWLFGILYIIMGYLYLDQRKDIKNSSSVLQSEKQEFFKGVETTLYRDITDIKVSIEGMKGEINLILDRQNRDNPVTPTNAVIQPVYPPSITVNPLDTTQ
jgi:hypothetical protein